MPADTLRRELALWSTCLALVLLLDSAVPPAASGQQANPTTPAGSQETDEIISRKDRSRLKGKIQAANESGINFKQQGKLARVMPADDYAIVVWHGVTDALELARKAQASFALVNQSIAQIAGAQGDDVKLKATAEEEHRQALELYDAVRRFDDAQILESLPFAQPLSDDTVKVLLSPADLSPQLRSLKPRLDSAAEARRHTLDLRKQLNLVQSRLTSRNFEGAEQDCRLIAQEISKRAATLKQQGLPIDGYPPFLRALELLRQTVEQMGATRKIVARLPSLETLQSDFAALNGLLQPAETNLSILALLGEPVTQLLERELKICGDYHERLLRFQELTAELRTAMTDFDRMAAVLNAQPAVDESQIAGRITAHEERLTQLAERLKSESPADLAAIARSETVTYSRRSLERAAVLLLRKIDLPQATTELQLAGLVSTRTAAEQSLSQLEARARKLQIHLDRNRLVDLKDQTDCRNMLQIVKVNSERLTGRLLEFDRNETREAFLQQSKRMDELLRTARDADPQRLAAGLRQIHDTVSKLADGFSARLANAANPPDGADQLLRSLHTHRQETAHAIEFVGWRAKLADIPADPGDTTGLEAAETELTAVKARLGEHADGLPSAFEPVRQQTFDDVARLELSLQFSRSKLHFADAERSVRDMLSQAESALRHGELPLAGTQLYLASTSAAGLAELALHERHLAKEPAYAERAAALTQAAQPLGEQLAVARDQERRSAGWISWMDDDSFLVAPTAEQRWLQIESLLSQRRFEDVEQRLNEFGAQFPDAAWQRRIVQMRAELQFQRGRLYEQQGRFEDARAAYQRTVDSELDHPVTAAAEAAIRNVDEQLLQARQAGNFGMLLVGGAAGLGVLALGLGFLIWKRSDHARLKHAARCLERARRETSPTRRDALVREAAYILANLPEDDPRVASLWNQPALQQPRASAVSGRAAEAHLVEQPLPPPHEVIDAALVSQAAPEVIAAACLAWLKSPEARGRANRRRNQAVGEWLHRYLEPKDSNTDGELEQKADILQQLKPLLPARSAWPALFQMRACYLLGRFEDAVAAAGTLSADRLSPPQLEELARTVVSCHLQLEQWTAAEAFIKTIARRKPKIPELRDWLIAARAGRRLTRPPAEPTQPVATMPLRA